MPAQILVVDDEPSVLAVVARALREDGHDVITVSNSQVAYDVAKNQAIDVVITNSSMPGFTGTEPVMALRNLFPTLPVLHLRDHPNGMQPGFPLPDDIPTLLKPFDLNGLKAAVRLLLGPLTPSRSAPSPPSARSAPSSRPGPGLPHPGGPLATTRLISA